jgi:hypothetical protein
MLPNDGSNGRGHGGMEPNGRAVLEEEPRWNGSLGGGGNEMLEHEEPPHANRASLAGGEATARQEEGGDGNVRFGLEGGSGLHWVNNPRVRGLLAELKREMRGEVAQEKPWPELRGSGDWSPEIVEAPLDVLPEPMATFARNRESGTGPDLSRTCPAFRPRRIRATPDSARSLGSETRLGARRIRRARHAAFLAHRALRGPEFALESRLESARVGRRARTVAVPIADRLQPGLQRWAGLAEMLGESHS